MPESRDSNVALGTDVLFVITVREKKFKSIQKNASWQICVDEANDLQKSPPESLLYPSRNLQKSMFPCLA